MKKFLFLSLMMFSCVHVDDVVSQRYKFDDLYCWKKELNGKWYPIGEPNKCPEGSDWK